MLIGLVVVAQRHARGDGGGWRLVGSVLTKSPPRPGAHNAIIADLAMPVVPAPRRGRTWLRGVLVVGDRGTVGDPRTAVACAGQHGRPRRTTREALPATDGRRSAAAFPPGWIGPGRDPWGAAGRSIRSVTARRSSTGPGVAPTFDRSRRTDLQLTHQSMQFRSTVTRDAAFGSALTAQSPWTMTISVLEATGVQHDWLWPIVTEAEL